MINLDLDFGIANDPSSPSVVVTEVIVDPIERRLQSDILKIQEAYTLFLKNMKEITESQRVLSKQYEALYFEHDREKFIHEVYGRLLSLVAKIASDAIGELSITNFKLPSYRERFDRGDDPQKWESPLAYWKRITADIDSYRKEGLSNHAKTLSNELLSLPYDHIDPVKNTRTGFTVDVSAWVSTYSWEHGYTHEGNKKLLSILESIREAVLSAELDNCFMTHSTKQIFEHFTSRAKSEYCEGVIVQTFKQKVVFHLSFEVMSAIQLFISEHGTGES